MIPPVLEKLYIEEKMSSQMDTASWCYEWTDRLDWICQGWLRYRSPYGANNRWHQPVKGKEVTQSEPHKRGDRFEKLSA